MWSDPLPEPWQSFLTDLDREATEPIALTCIGGFAVSLYYGLTRPTGDIDVVDVLPNTRKSWLAKTAGEGSSLHRRHKVHVQIVGVATLPYNYEERVAQLSTQFTQLRLFVLDPYDLALSKLTRNLDVDFDDVKYLAQAQTLDLDLLDARYHEELRPYAIGPPERHDLTMRLWLEAIREIRDKNA